MLMIKRLMAAGLSALLLSTAVVPAFAVDETAETEETEQNGQTGEAEENGPVKLTFDTLEQTVRENNISIKAYDNTIKGAEETDVDDQYEESLDELELQMWSYKSQISQLQESLNGITGENTGALKAAIKAQIDMLQSSLSALQSSYDDMEDQRDDAAEDQEKTVDSTRREMGNAADLICMNAENTYIQLQSMQYSFAEAARSLAQLDRNIAMTEKQLALGMVGENTLKSLQSQRETLLASQSALQTQLDALTNTLALQCGLALGTEIEIEPVPALAQEQLDAMSYETDLAEALENSYSIWASEQAVEDASDDYANGVTDNLYTFEAAKIERDAEKENVTASFRALYKDVGESVDACAAAQSNLEQAEKTFAVQQLQYELGMISEMAYADAQDTLAAAQESTQTAEIELFTAYNTYQWAKRGVMSSAA